MSIQLSGGQSPDFSIHHIFQLLVNLWFDMFNLLSCPSVFSVNIILNQFFVHVIVKDARSLWSFCCRLLVGSQAAQCPMGSYCLCLHVALAFIRLMTLLCGPLYRFAISACWKWWKVLFRSIDYWSLGWLCCLAECWMLQDMDNIEASCVFDIKVSMFTHLERSKTSLWTVNKSEIVTLTIQHNLLVSISFMYYPADNLRSTLADVLSLEQCPIYSWQSCDFSCRKPQFILVNRQKSSDWLIAHLGAVGNPCNFQLYAAGFILSITNMLVADYSVLTWC